MVKELWLNLPAKDVQRSKKFFEQLGFKFMDRFDAQSPMQGLKIGNTNVMLCSEELFKSFAGNTPIDYGKEVMISFDAESPEEVDAFAQKAEAAGGAVFGQPGWNQGWMYGCGFTDIDGHRWNVLHMDMSKMK